MQSPASSRPITRYHVIGWSLIAVSAIAAYASALRYIHHYSIPLADVWLVFAALPAIALFGSLGVLPTHLMRRRRVARWNENPPRLDHQSDSNQLVATWPIDRGRRGESVTLGIAETVAVLQASEPARKTWREQDYAVRSEERLDVWLFVVGGEVEARLVARSGQRGDIVEFLVNTGIRLGLSHCPEGGYNFGGVPTQHCPECGLQTPIDRAR